MFPCSVLAHKHSWNFNEEESRLCLYPRSKPVFTCVDTITKHSDPEHNEGNWIYHFWKLALYNQWIISPVFLCIMICLWYTKNTNLTLFKKYLLSIMYILDQGYPRNSQWFSFLHHNEKKFILFGDYHFYKAQYYEGRV